jgi:hypothetical protein
MKMMFGNLPVAPERTLGTAAAQSAGVPVTLLLKKSRRFM